MATRPSALRAFREALAATSVRSNPAARKKAAGGAAESPAALIGLSEALQEMARRFLLVEPKDVPDADLVAVLFAGAVEGDPTEAARDLLNDVQGNLARVARGEGFARRKGFSDLALARMTAAAELIKRAERRAAVEGLGEQVTGPMEAENVARAYIGGPREQMGALFFDTKMRLLGFRLLSMGGQTMTVADPREVVISALEMRATVVILVHNHPSGIASPSGPDDTTTAKLKEILRLLGMQLADHIILGKSGNTYSYALNARLNPRRANPRRRNPRAKRVPVDRFWTLPEKLEETLTDVAEGRRSYSYDAPLRVSALDTPRGHYFVLDGHHRLVEHIQAGDREVAVEFDVYIPRIERTGGAYADMVKRKVNIATRVRAARTNPSASENGRYHFVTDCIGSTYEDISALKETGEDVSRTAFARALGPEAWKEIQTRLGYDRDFPISRDWHVGYYRGTYRGVPAYYLVWSGIEHIFTLDGEQGRSLARSRR